MVDDKIARGSTYEDDVGLPGTVEESSLCGEKCPYLVGVPSLKVAASRGLLCRCGTP
jgi:hypothetical protein